MHANKRKYLCRAPAAHNTSFLLTLFAFICVFFFFILFLLKVLKLYNETAYYQSLYPVRHFAADIFKRLTVYLANSRFGNIQHLTDFFKVELFVVIQRHDHLFAL